MIFSSSNFLIAFYFYLHSDEKDGCDVSSSLELSSSEKVGICTTLTKTVSCGSYSPLKMIDDKGKYTTETYCSNEVLALPLPGLPGKLMRFM